MHKYFVLMWNRDDPESNSQVATIRSALLRSPPWRVAYDGFGVLVVHQPSAQRSSSLHRLAESRGVVLGALYHRSRDDTTPHPVDDLDLCETARVVKSGGRHLVENYWGSYIAVVCDPISQERSVLRDPTATLACFCARWRGIYIMFSDIDDLICHIPLTLSVNWRHIAAHLLGGFKFSRECAVNEVEDIPGGEWLTFETGIVTRVQLWRPAQFCVEDPLEDEATAAHEMRSAVIGAVDVLASEHDDILLLLSGGLDSSIVAACFSQQSHNSNVTCLNFHIPADGSTSSPHITIPGLSTENLAKVRRLIGSADEREYARKGAARCGFPLIERERLPFELNFDRICNAPFAPRPSSYAFLLDLDDKEYECASDMRATACFTGQGGDTVFYATLRAIGALDYAFLHPLGSRLFQHIADTATLSRESFAHVFAKVIKHGFLRTPLPPPFESTKSPHLLRDDVGENVSSDYFHHPWIEGAGRLSPGKREHVLGVTSSVPAYHNVYRRERIAPSVHPLASQPVVETCLRIPTYVLLAGGVSRGLARRAFRDLLSPEVVKRTVKGSGLAFYQNLLRRNMPSIRDHLLDGILVREGLLHRQRLEAYLTNEQMFLTVQANQIMDYIACEAWLSQHRSAKFGVHPSSIDTFSVTSLTASAASS